MAQVIIKFKNTKAANIYKGLHLNHDVPKDGDLNPTMTDLEFLKKVLEERVQMFELDGRRQTKKEALQAEVIDPTITDTE